MNLGVQANDVHKVIGQHMLADGMPLVIDLEKSNGAYLVDERNGETYIDFFSFFASQALGLNHPKLTDDEFIKEIGRVAVNKPSNSDVYSTVMASFVKTFGEIAMPKEMKYTFFVEGGALGNENALKAAFDWKVRKNKAKGIEGEKGQKVIHFKEAFHGRTGYTMSLTNTDPNKVMYFPKFDWPRIVNPKVTFPLEENLETIIKTEQEAEAQIREAVKNNPDDIAALIIEPIQGEGGDNMFRKEFLQKLRDLANELDFMLIFDEVQTGVGMTGKMWACEHYVMPDMITFGKKMQVCGVMCSDRIDEVEDHVFKKSSRINSTWGGNLTDMFRAEKILKVIKEDNLIENAKVQGEYLLGKLKEMQAEYPELLSNARGLGLWASIDFPNGETRDKFVNLAFENKLAMLGCGQKTLRFRPALVVDQKVIDEALTIMKKVLDLMK